MNCIDCFNFKTRIIHGGNLKVLHQLQFNSFKKVLNILKKDPKARILYCKYFNTKNNLYVNTPSYEIRNIKHPTKKLLLQPALRILSALDCKMASEEIP